MKTIRTTLLAALLLIGTSAFAGQVSFGIRIGPPPAPRVFHVQPASPGPAYVWVDGYWYPVGNHYRWHQGYWTRPPYEGAQWIGPRHENGMYYNGYWEGEHGRIQHDHRWDRERNRDYHEHYEHHEH
jgi:hypothetical protein